MVINYGQGTTQAKAETTAYIDPEAVKQRKQEAIDKQKCREAGGKWDAKTKTCSVQTKINPDPNTQPKQPDTPPKVNASNVETFSTNDTQRASGVTMPDGRTFLGLGPEDVNKISQGEAERVARPEGTNAVGTAQNQANEQFALEQSIGQIGQIGQLTPAEQADINFSQAIAAGAARVAPAAAGGAAVGAAAGLVGSGGAFSVPGAIVVGAAGAVGGFISGVMGNIKEQQRGELQAADIELTNARTSMRQLAMLASQNPQNADMYIAQYNQVLTRVHQARRQTQAEVSGDINAFMEDGREQLADFDIFLNEGGLADIYSQKMIVALQSGIPLSIDGESLIQ